MALKAFIFAISLLLTVSAVVSSNDHEELLEAEARPPPVVSAKAPAPTVPAPPIESVVPPPPPAPVMSPVPAPPVKLQPTPPGIKPSSPPPVYKPPSPPLPVPKYPPTPPRNTKECFPPCVVRCKLHSRKNRCLRACVTCCDRCKCVPPGQYGNREKCGECYANMTTHGGKPKCP